jgi:Na+/melibiose symporter-like transporter
MLDMAYFRNPAFSTATGGMTLVFLSMFGVMFLITQYFQLILGYSPLSAALRFLPIAPIMMVVSPLTPRIIARVGHNRTVAFGMTSVAFAFLLWSRLTVDSSYWYVLVCVIFQISGIALTMSPMTAAIMSAVPPRRAGAGSAMNDATRELGTALGVAVLGSIAASRYAAKLQPSVRGMNVADRAAARTSLGSAIETAHRIGGRAGERLLSGAQHAFVSGIHTAALGGSALALIAALTVLRFLPRQIAQHGAERSAVSAMEETAELGVAGVLPVIADAE